MITEYANITLPAGTTIYGRHVRALSAKQGYRLTRVTADGRDDLRITYRGQVWELAWLCTLGGSPLGADAPPLAKAVAKPIEGERDLTASRRRKPRDEAGE